MSSSLGRALSVLVICALALLANADDALSAAARSVGVKPQMLSLASKMTSRSPASLVNILQTDKSASITATGAVQYGCDLHDHPHDSSGVLGFNPDTFPEADTLAVNDHAASTSPADAFKLHSRQDSPLKIFLEFNGCVTEDTDGWNKNLGLEKIITPPYDSDGKPGFSEEEQREIITIWQGVREHFSLWAVDVTTEDPGHEGLERSDEKADTSYGIRVCVGGTGNWTGAVIGGIALMNSFGYVIKPGGEVYRDCFVFSSNLLNREDRRVNIGYVWKSISHEVGHTLGLAHKGVRLPNNQVEEYYRIPPAPGLWAPVMGVPGRGLFVQWSNGSYPAEMGPSSNTDDDLAIISATLPLLGDERGTSALDARVLCKDTPCISSHQHPNFTTAVVTATISCATDRDYYNVTVTDMHQPLMLTLQYEPNWIKRSVDTSGAEFLQVWRVSNLRLWLQFVQQDVAVLERQAVSEWSTQQEFEVIVHRAGTYTFWLQPTEMLRGGSSSGALALPTNYGNVGHYNLTATFSSAVPLKQGL